MVARLLGRERLLSREEVNRLQELRGTYGIAAPAPICPEGTDGIVAGDDAACQTLEAPASPGQRLVDDTPASPGRAAPVAAGAGDGRSGDATEIQLPYRELASLIEDAISRLRK